MALKKVLEAHDHRDVAPPERLRLYPSIKLRSPDTQLEEDETIRVDSVEYAKYHPKVGPFDTD